ncbi:hypothetical protein HDU67_006277 [Dinochytrium kinnereticum]|nr:hypothetical protein HDU67_006277 [Dinochytrium kinnereticum]
MDPATAFRQDMPPAGGFPETIQFKRNIPGRGPSGAVMILATVGIMAYGWHWLSQSNAERRELRREKAWARIHLVPLLQAETDRDLVRRLDSVKSQEAQIMKNVDGWSPLDLKAPVRGVGRYGYYNAAAAEPVYHTEKYVKPTYIFLPPESDHRIEPQWWRGSKMFMRNPPYHERADWKGKENPTA